MPQAICHARLVGVGAFLVCPQFDHVGADKVLPFLHDPLVQLQDVDLVDHAVPLCPDVRLDRVFRGHQHQRLQHVWQNDGRKSLGVLRLFEELLALLRRPEEAVEPLEQLVPHKGHIVQVLTHILDALHLLEYHVDRVRLL